MGGSSGGEGRTPYEAPDSGRSTQQVKIVEVISEGEIQGLVNGAKSVFLDNTPIQAEDDSYNFTNVETAGRIGSQDQAVMVGFDTTEKEISVGTEVRKRMPLTRTITDGKVTRLRLTLGVSALFRQEDNGDTLGTTVDFKITVGSRVYSLSINGKYSSQYLRNLVIDNLPPVPFTVKVERMQDDSKSQRLQNKTIWASYTEIIDTEFAYPNTALVGIKFDSDYFSNVPTRSYEIYGIKIKVPSNYDPVTRTYSGLWDGIFKIAYSDNPALILMDIVTNKRYGLGQRLGEFGVDKWALYQAAQYCDQMIPDGYGGTRPRFTCNVWLTEQRSAYDVINDICSIFRAMPVWNGAELTVIMDRPSDPVWTYTNANVINGEFSRQYSAVKARHNAIQVEYQDAANNYEKAIEYVSNDDDIRKYGLNLKKVVAFGCTNRGQAYCTGRWILETERLETETITFSVGSEGLMHIPGDIIRVSDNNYAGTDIGGRVLSFNGRTVTLDREIQLNGNSYFSYINTEAKHSNILILRAKGNVIILDSEPIGLTDTSIWSLATQTITSRLYRAMSIAENDNGSYTIVALQHEPQKEAIVDNGAVFEPVNTTLHRAPKVEHLDVDLTSGNAKLTWQTTSGIGTVTYDVRILKVGKLYAQYKGLTISEVAFDNLPDGEYQIVIQAKNASGQIVSEKSKTFTINRPPVPQNVQVLGGLSEISLAWDYVDNITQTEIWASETNDIRTAKRIAKVLASFYSHAVRARQTRYYWLRHTRGQNVGNFYQQQGLRAETGADIDEELRLLNEKLSEPIINQVFDVAAPARQLEMIKVVPSITNKSQFLGHTLIKNQADNRLYKWNGRSYEYNTPASEIDGRILPTQLAEIPTTKLSGQITPMQLSTVPTGKLSGTLSAGQIGANTIGVNHLQANAITTEKLSANAVTAEKMSVNSVGANHIQANAVVAGKIAVNAIQAGNIQAGAINANHLQAGQISTDKLAVGLGGNLLYNPIFANNGDGWATSNGNYTGGTINRRYFSKGTSNWEFKNPISDEERLAVVTFNENITSTKNQWADVVRQKIHLIPNQWYIFSAYVNTYRCAGIMLVEELRADGSYVRAINTSPIHNRGSFINGIDGDSRNFVKFRCPASGYVEVMVRVTSLSARNPDVYVARPMLEECTEHTNQPSSWVNAGITAIHGGSIKTRTITAQQIAANTITSNEIVANAINAKHIATGTINAQHIHTRAISADKLNIQSLSAISANLGTVTAGTIRGTTISGNTITGNTVSGGTITGTTISGTTINGGNISGSNISGVTIRGGHLEGATGSFTGTLTVGQLIGSNILEVVTLNNISYSTERRGHRDNQRTYNIYSRRINIKAAPVERFFTILNSNIAEIIPANQAKVINYRSEHADGERRPAEIQHDSSIRMTVLLIARTSPKTIS